MTWKHYILNALAVLAISSASTRLPAAEEEKPAGDKAKTEEPAKDESSAFGVSPDGNAGTYAHPMFLGQDQPGYGSDYDVRFGWWAKWHTGSPSKVGEYEDLNPSPFFDVDGLSSDGTRTLGVTVTGNDQETMLGNVHYYQGGVSADIGYQRFLHELDHNPLGNITTAGPGITSPDPLVIKEDLGAGQNYAIRVQELKGSFKVVSDENFKVRLDVWGQRKEGTRQANAIAMCYTSTGAPATLPDGHPLTPFPGQRCHLLSQPQQIDWTTQEIKPVIEGHLGDRFVVEYSRPMRAFNANDQIVTRFYDHFSGLSGSFPYAVVPDNYTDMDQVKISGNLTEDTTAYAYLMAGRTVDKEIADMTRFFNDMDVRVTNKSIANTTVTGYGTIYNDSENRPDVTKLDQASFGDANLRPARLAQQPVDYHKSTLGAKALWRPAGGGFEKGGWSVNGGYEYADLNRTDAIWSSPTAPTTASPVRVSIDESNTITHCFQVGPDYRWSACFDTYARYKFQNAVQPLIGFKQDNGVFNTLLPQHDHIVEIGFNWFPTEHFLFNACIGVERGDNHSQPAMTTNPAIPNTINFDEENYPMTFSAWYGATKKLSFTAGYAVFSNFVAQDIVIGDDPFPYGTSAGRTSIQPTTNRWNYNGQAHVVTLGVQYCASDRVRLTGDLEWVHGRDSIDNSTTFFPVPGDTLTNLGRYSEVLNETTRLTLGVDWTVRPRVVVYGRYELYNFTDANAVDPGNQTGLAMGILGGFSALF